MPYSRFYVMKLTMKLSLWYMPIGDKLNFCRVIEIGEGAIICYLHACRSSIEGRTRKYLAKAIWLLTYDDENLTLATTLDKHHNGIPAIHWLPWYVCTCGCLFFTCSCWASFFVNKCFIDIFFLV